MPAEQRTPEEVAEMVKAMGDWAPYSPPGYPGLGPHHNPYLPVTQTGTTSADIFIDLGRDPERFLRRLNDDG